MIAIIRPRVRNLRGLSMIIYKATNLVNGKVYVGQTVNTLKYRKEQHWREAICPSRKNVHFHNALLKYGIDNFEFEIIDRARDVDELNKKESYWIDYYNSTDSRYGYNKDSGGKSGGFKSQETKEKIGLTTREKWSRPETAMKMRDGLSKGTQTWKEICWSRRILFICPYCGREELLPVWEARNKSACSKKCKLEHAGFRNNAIQASKKAAEITHERNLRLKEQMAFDILNWCKSNPEIIRNCPYNAITTGLQPMIDYICDKYNIMDLRSMFVCFNVSNKKEFLSYLKSKIS